MSLLTTQRDRDKHVTYADEAENILTYLQRRFVVSYPEDASHMQWISPQAIILFETGERSTILETVVRTLMHPIGIGQVTSVIVQEPLRESLIKAIRTKMQVMDERITEHPNFQNTMQLIRRMRPQIIYMEENDNNNDNYIKKNSPIVVCDFPQSYFGDKPTGIITLNTFRTLKEAVRLCNREGLDFQLVSVWTKKLTEAYEMAAALSKVKYFAINCLDAPFDAIKAYIDKPETVSTIARKMHFEVLLIMGMPKVIAFPVKTVFGN